MQISSIHNETTYKKVLSTKKSKKKKFRASSNVRRFQSNQSISDINNIHADRVTMSFDRRNANIDEKTKSENVD